MDIGRRSGFIAIASSALVLCIFGTGCVSTAQKFDHIEAGDLVSSSSPQTLEQTSSLEVADVQFDDKTGSLNLKINEVVKIKQETVEQRKNVEVYKQEEVCKGWYWRTNNSDRQCQFQRDAFILGHIILIGFVMDFAPLFGIDKHYPTDTLVRKPADGIQDVRQSSNVEQRKPIENKKVRLRCRLPDNKGVREIVANATSGAASFSLRQFSEVWNASSTTPLLEVEVDGKSVEVGTESQGISGFFRREQQIIATEYVKRFELDTYRAASASGATHVMVRAADCREQLDGTYLCKYILACPIAEYKRTIETFFSSNELINWDIYLANKCSSDAAPFSDATYISRKALSDNYAWRTFIKRGGNVTLVNGFGARSRGASWIEVGRKVFQPRLAH